ncbi:carbon-nitrogen hydrolase family protein [Paenibacillus aurantius]|uniref:Carbon-nitrogen hydrolase family protein n=1 Tax=Paenibacillus aurantius TaxID=2918900 RepID=A0AA96LEK5_9BACL|nr:carbon-nitrogen hydrolase family protein [Paenibacillus aurantius]WNQ10670.1 carbon-nitrogen hydrolase family protein [Paenibacillus aurantius]
MANYVKISCLTAPPLRVGEHEDDQEIVYKIIAYWREQLEQVLPDRPDLILLPEMCDAPDGALFPAARMADYYRQRKDQVRDFFAKEASEHGCYMAYSAMRLMTDGSFRNSMQLIGRDGKVAGVYNKNHLLIEECTENNARYGNEAPIIETDFGRVACVICFDLNFDDLRLHYAQAKPDLILFSSIFHGGFMQQYWAYSCRAHLASSVYPTTPSQIITPVGEIIGASTNYFHHVTRTVNLDCAVIHLDHNAKHFPAIKKKYGSKVKIDDPGRLGSVLISSETEEFTVQDILTEYGLERLDDYLARSLNHRHAPGNME